MEREGEGDDASHALEVTFVRRRNEGGRRRGTSSWLGYEGEISEVVVAEEEDERREAV